jgi:hypothetical protein
MTPDTNAILDAIRSALNDVPGGDGVTVPELTDMMAHRDDGPMSEESVRKGVKRLLAEGLMEPCRLRRKRMDGILTVCSGYRMRNGHDGKRTESTN